MSVDTVVSRKAKQPGRAGPPGRAFAMAGSLPAEGAVLTHLLDQHPRCLTFPQLVDEVPGGFELAALKRAVHNLAAARFLFLEGANLMLATGVVAFDRMVAI